jgi:hypothetical protein
MTGEDTFIQNYEVAHILGTSTARGRGSDPVPRTNRVIRSAEARSLGRSVCVVGGDTDDGQEHEPPSIIVTKDGEGRIARILVRCSCGQHAELVCQYD